MAQSTGLEIDYNKLVGYSGKTMLVLTIVCIDSEPFLRIESEPHYWRDDRMIVSEVELNLKNKKDHLNDFQFCLDIGFYLFLDLLIRNHYGCSILSIHEYHGYPVIRYDYEKYSAKEARKLVDQIPLPPWDNKDEILHNNDRLLQAVGKKILEILLSYENEWPPKHR